MIRNTRKIAVLCVVMALAGCGKMGDLEPRTGQSMPPLAYGQNDEQSAGKLMEPSPQARPTRSDELVSKSALREDDPFDFAPGQPVPPFPGKEEEEAKKAENNEPPAKTDTPE